MKSICVDIGNTSTKVGIFENEQLKSVQKGLNNIQLLQLCNSRLDHHIIVSAVTDEFKHVFNLLEHKERFTVLSTQLKAPIKNAYKSPETLGSDRLAAIVGGTHLFPEADILVIQTGTCFTYDFATKDAIYLGGGISPGLQMRFLALKEFTARLPLVDMDITFDQLVGGDTVESIKSGVINGCITELEGTIDRYLVEYPNVKVILTGGWTNYFESKINRTKFAFQDLVLVGLNKILIHNNV